jgi:eukaryotic-like serine/threonine-protein kinase
MQARRWEEVEHLFAELITLSPDRRAAFIDRTCADDDELRREIDSLLRSHDGQLGALDVAPLFSLDEDAVDDRSMHETQGAEAPGGAAQLGPVAGTRIGPYQLLRQIGEGGMGSVWLAERADGAFKRTVALKLPHVSWSGALAERLARERDILASLEHPNIARLYDAGVAVDGRPYLALEYIEGTPLTRYCDREGLAVARRLELFTQVLDAVRHAHAHLVIHRDIKPSNILVSADGRVHLLDFGIAKLLTSDGAGEMRTQWEARVLTPDYASPEQVTGDLVSTASDVYSLGVLLHELLCGSRPYMVKRGSRSSLERAILETEPSPPSRMVAADTARACGTTPAGLARTLRGDIDNIVRKAMQKAPLDRYTGADPFAQDIQRYLRGQPILAQPGSAWYHAGKFLRRHKLAVAATSAVLVALVVGLAAAIWQMNRAAEQSRRAEIEARTSRAVEAFLTDIFQTNSRSQPDPLQARQTTARELLAIGVKKIDAALADAPAARLRMLKTLADLQHQLALEDEAVALNRKQVELTKQLYGAQDPRVAAALWDLSLSMMASRASGEREMVLQEALAILDRAGDFTSQLRGNLLGDYAQWAFAHDIKRSLHYAQESSRLLRAYPPSDDLAEALIMEGVIESRMGKYAKAEAMFDAALDVAKKTGGERGPKLARIHGYRAEVRYSRGAWPGAEQDLRAGYGLARELGGDDDMHTIQLQNRLALILLRTSRAKEAREHAVQARDAILRVSADDDAWYVPMTLEIAGLVLGEVGELEAGLTDLLRAAQTWRRYHAGSSDVIGALERTAVLMTAAGRLAEADALLNEAAEIRRKVQDYQTNLNGNLVARTSWLIASGRAPEALPLLEEFQVRPAEPGSISVSALQRTIYSAKIQLASGRPAEAIASAQEVAKLVTASALRPYLKTYEADAALVEGKARVALADQGAALGLLERAHALYSEVYDGRSSLVVADSKVALGRCLLALGRAEEARALARDAAAIQAAHERVGNHYRRPLRELRAKLSGSS